MAAETPPKRRIYTLILPMAMAAKVKAIVETTTIPVTMLMFNTVSTIVRLGCLNQSQRYEPAHQYVIGDST